MSKLKTTLKWGLRIFLGIVGLLIGVFLFFFLKYRTLSPQIAYIKDKPLIDGALDKNLSGLVIRNFPLSYKLNSNNPDVHLSYRLAYSMNYLYLYVEMEAENYVCRNRGYQNGDGIILILTKPRILNLPTDDYFMLGFSPQDREDAKWAKKILWYRNYKAHLKTLSENVKFKYKRLNGKVGFEILLPWEEIYPYHPWFKEGIGLNMAFVKAVGEKSATYYSVFPDFAIGKENSNRYYANLKFQKPETLKKGGYLRMVKNHIVFGNKAKVKAVTLPASKVIQYFISNKITPFTCEGKLILEDKRKHLNSQVLNINTENLDVGDYWLKWNMDENISSGQLPFSIRPEFNCGKKINLLNNCKNKITVGSLNTLKFKINKINKQIQTLRDYDSGSLLVKEIDELNNYLKKAEAGDDVLASQTGVIRRAFLSKIDSTLQPYSVKLPKDYDPNKKYPLMVFLHGSSRDDKGIFSIHTYLSQGDFIQVAPNGRGKSNYYTVDFAQEDISEAINDLIENYSVDTSNIILTGFSMGGYGVYRTFFENPSRYKAIAIFSGEPRIPQYGHTVTGDHPDFLKEKYLKCFKGIPVFIFHGKKDRNCPYELTEKLIQKLKGRGAELQVCCEENSGHSSPKEEKSIEKYHEWLQKIVNK